MVQRKMSERKIRINANTLLGAVMPYPKPITFVRSFTDEMLIAVYNQHNISTAQCDQRLAQALSKSVSILTAEIQRRGLTVV